MKSRQNFQIPILCCIAAVWRTQQNVCINNLNYETECLRYHNNEVILSRVCRSTSQLDAKNLSDEYICTDRNRLTLMRLQESCTTFYYRVGLQGSAQVQYSHNTRKKFFVLQLLYCTGRWRAMNQPTVTRADASRIEQIVFNVSLLTGRISARRRARNRSGLNLRCVDRSTRDIYSWTNQSRDSSRQINIVSMLHNVTVLWIGSIVCRHRASMWNASVRPVATRVKSITQ